MATSWRGDGATVAFGTSSFAAKVDSIRWTGFSRDAIDMSDLSATGGMSYQESKMYDPGSIQLDGAYDNSDTGDPPMTGAAETITITLPKRTGQSSTGGTIVASGFLTSFEATFPKRDKQGFSATFKLSGNVTITAGS